MTPDPACPGTGKHGTASAYWNRDCRCPDAIEAARIYRSRWRHGYHTPAHVPAVGTQRRLRALAALGWSADALARHLGCGLDQVLWLRRAHDAGRTVHRDSATRVTTLYDQLSATPGPSTKARRAALAAGWPPPLAWDTDDLDDPTARPDVGRPPVGRICLDDVDHLAAFGMPLDQIAARLDVDVESIKQARRRAARPTQDGGQRAS